MVGQRPRFGLGVHRCRSGSARSCSSRSSWPGRPRPRRSLSTAWVTNSPRVRPPTGPAGRRPGAGTCSLRAALQEANGTGGTDTIDFSIGPSALRKRSPSSRPTGHYPQSSRPSSSTATPRAAGLHRTADHRAQRHFGGRDGRAEARGGKLGSTIRGLVINRSPGYAVRILGSSNNVIAGNFLGTDVAGTAPLPNSTGVFIQTGTGNVIGGRWPPTAT